MHVYETETLEEFIEEMEGRIEEERSSPENKKDILRDRYRLIVTTFGDNKAFLRPIVNIANTETVVLEGMNPDQAKEIVDAGEDLNIEIKEPLDYDLSIPVMRFETAEEFIEEMKSRIKEERKLNKDRYRLRVTRAGDQEAYLRPNKSVGILDVIFTKGLTPDEGKKIEKEGRKLDIEVKRPLSYSIS